MRFITSLFFKIKTFAIWCINAGVKPDMDTQFLKRVQVSNILSISLGLMTTAYIFIFMWMKSYENVAVAIFISIFMISVPFQNRLGFTRLSRILTIIFGLASILIVAMSLGKQAGVHYLYLLAAIIVMFFFTPYEKKYIICSYLLLILALIIVWRYSTPYNQELVILKKDLYLLLNTLLFFTTLLFIVITSFLVYYNDYTIEKEIKTANRQLRKEISNRKRIEDELKRTNKELEYFAYIASHDLQEPLRMIASYVALLERRNKDKFDSDSKEFIEFALDGASRMKQLINDLLHYSRIGTRGSPFKETDVENIFTQTIKNLEVGIREVNANITHDRLPTIIADESQLIQLFQNLIGNALKFCADRTPEIHVTAKKEQNSWIFGVHDNGIGIEAKHVERVFQIFQKLHTRKAYQGTGIGLAVCKKIVERHHGNIWIESEIGKGTTFWFTIPLLSDIDVDED